MSVVARGRKMRNCMNSPPCRKKASIGEQVISSVLDEEGVLYYYDMPLCGLRGIQNGTLKFDFCIPGDQKNGKLGSSQNMAVIEYNGIFHYHVIYGKTSKMTLEKQQTNDLIKQEYCKLQNIPILSIPYWHHVKRVKELVRNFTRCILDRDDNSPSCSSCRGTPLPRVLTETTFHDP